MTYSEKLKDPRWQKKRLEILNRDGFKCLACGDGKNTLHVHHCYYVSKRDPWEYRNESLLTFCAKCHKDVDSDIDSKAYWMAKAWEYSANAEMRRHLFFSSLADDGGFDRAVYRWDEGLMWALEECWGETAQSLNACWLVEALMIAASIRVLTPEWVEILRGQCREAAEEGVLARREKASQSIPEPTTTA